MKRYSLIQARGGDFAFNSEGSVIEDEGNDVVSLGIKHGKVSLIVPAELPDDKVCQESWLNKHAYLEFELEDGTHITGWVRAGETDLEVARLAKANGNGHSRAGQKK